MPELSAPSPIPVKPQLSPTEEGPDPNDQLTAAPPKKKINIKLVIIAGRFTFFIFAMILAAFSGGGSSGGSAVKPKEIIPTPTMVPLPTVPDFSLGEATIYASDPQILQLEGALNNFERQLDDVDTREQEIDPPVLMMDVNFKKK